MASFTGVGDNTTLSVVDVGEDVLIALSGTYNMTILFQREVGKGSGAYETLKTYNTVDATVSENYRTNHYDAKYRLIVSVDTSGTCTATLTDNSDKIVRTFKDNVGNNLFQFRQSGVIESNGVNNFQINSGITSSDQAGKTIRLNSITNTGTGNDFIGFQSKPAQGAATAKNVIGAEVSARVNSTFALTSSGTLIGMHVDAYLRGTAGDIGGDVRGMQVELVTDDAGTRTITGDVVGLRMRAAFSGTISGDMVAIKIEKAEAQTNSNQWEYVLELTDVNGLIWDDDWGTEPSTAAGGFKVRINGQDRWVQTYSSAPS